MRMIRIIISAAAFVVTLTLAATAQTPPAAQAPKADITGQWTSTFETMVGAQSYTYDFVLKDGKLTGKMKGDLSDAPADVKDGKVEGDKVTFGETLIFQGMEIQIAYSGTITSADEIKLTRHVGEFATEELVVRRVKK